MNTIICNSQKIKPSKIVCIGRNYVDHIHELNNEIPDEMVVFNKPNSAISNILNSFHEEQLHYEGELCFVYQNGKFVAVGFGLDLTKRQLQSTLKQKGLPWERAKAFDGSALFSDFVAINDISDGLSLELKINNDIIQSGGINLMMNKPQDMLKQLQTFMTLADGDIVMTGTPKGVGPVNQGDIFTGRVRLGDEVIVESRWIAQ